MKGGTGMTGQGPRRADATRNRAAILDAARTLIAAHGTDVGMDRIAATAGVAVGTLYRHFPTKHDLVAAIVADLGVMIGETLGSALASIGEGRTTARDEIVALLHRVVVTMGRERLLRDAVADVGRESLRPVLDHAVDSLAELVAAAHREHGLHPDVTVDDITLLLAASPGADVPEPARLRWVELARRALVPDDGTGRH
ncbi:TetR family transcriptional regulator [Saccharothrix carnea]|uniref:TetR family transcriptional regulator n=1 Tax=Saccharothrix carnea TaxID=1280637 RepID=A0A2P8I383_SACCR|nr:TetR/AcrR family transcriptional regulator [Saccharothrix carnea]PSL52926.1 TetR family transcriptional regulator [Saccharothrix carnea]